MAAGGRRRSPAPGLGRAPQRHRNRPGHGARRLPVPEGGHAAPGTGRGPVLTLGPWRRRGRRRPGGRSHRSRRSPRRHRVRPQRPARRALMEWFLANRAEVFSLAGQHLILAILPMVFGVLIAVPLAQLARQSRGLRSVVLTGSSLLYTIPSLALFIILPTILGTRILDPVNVVVALTIYAVALLVRATLDAFDSVDEDLRQAAVAMGFKPFARFMQIDLPLSLPVLFAGLRVVSVSNISLVSVAALLGISNLGMLFTSGLQRDFVTEVVVGIIAILLLALLMDAVLVLLERLLTPWTRAAAATGGGTGSGAGPDRTGPAAAAMRFSRPKTGGGNA